MKYSKKAIAGIAALALAASLSACDTEEDPNGNNGGTDFTTTTSLPGTTTLGDVATTTPGGVTTTAP